MHLGDLFIVEVFCMTEKDSRDSFRETIQREDKVYNALFATKSNENQLRSLDSYFGKLQNDLKLSQLNSSDKAKQVLNCTVHLRSKKGLESLDAYLGKLNEDENLENNPPSTYVEHITEGNSVPNPLFISKDSEINYDGKEKGFMEIRSGKGESNQRTSQYSQEQDDISSLYTMGILASVNIAVFLFEIASPIKNSDYELFSLPLLYGAKINHLIIDGEWWRLVTPMFLVQD
ncbi:Rhomboid-like protein [Quillaja saponaria]|uniref:Rhomboid-like protein n=1 Tax=Quillaja saponaria TaxID=32244 RepID=A0AAD7Q6F4_QUISA|nr:Rhomboid-like protein [Quillaja saponaria]